MQQRYLLASLFGLLIVFSVLGILFYNYENNNSNIIERTDERFKEYVEAKKMELRKMDDKLKIKQEYFDSVEEKINQITADLEAKRLDLEEIGTELSGQLRTCQTDLVAAQQMSKDAEVATKTLEQQVADLKAKLSDVQDRACTTSDYLQKKAEMDKLEKKLNQQQHDISVEKITLDRLIKGFAEANEKFEVDTLNGNHEHQQALAECLEKVQQDLQKTPQQQS